MALVREDRRVLGRRVRRVSFAAESHVGSDHLDLLAEPGWEAGVRQAFAGRLLQGSDGWDVLDLRDLDEGGPTVETVVAAFAGEGFLCRVTPRYVCPCEPLRSGESFEAFLRRTGRRENYLRRRKWLEAQPGFRIEKTERPEELPRVMAELFRLHRLRWQSDGGSDGIRGPRIEAFHRDATQLLAEGGRVRIYTMWLGRVAVASVYAILHGGTFYYYQSGYDPAWASKSVGLVLVGETFKDAIEGFCRYDFLRGNERYKSDWTTQRKRTVALRILRPGSVGAWFDRQERWQRGCRQGLKAILPGRLTEEIRRARRGLRSPSLSRSGMEGPEIP
jgi:hypothetical protein